MRKGFLLTGLLLQVALVSPVSGAAARASGEDIYGRQCSACHQEGKLGAPKVGDNEMWKVRVERGMDKLYDFALNEAYHPHCKGCQTSDVLAAVKYMVSSSTSSGNYSLW